MNHSLDTDSRALLAAWALQCLRNEIEDTILFHAPDSYSWADCDEVEETMLSKAKRTISSLGMDLLRNRKYMNHLITDAVSDTHSLLRSRPGKLS
jgi:hypothetical protein